VNLNAIDQTLKQILTRIARQVDVRWEMDGQTPHGHARHAVPQELPHRLREHEPRRERTIACRARSSSPPSAGTAAGSGSQNSSLLKVDNIAKNRFWETLEKNVKEMLRETDKQLPEGSSETFVQARGQGQTATTQSRTAPRTPRQRHRHGDTDHGHDHHARRRADGAGAGVRRAAPYLPRGRLGDGERRGGHHLGARPLRDQHERIADSSRRSWARRAARS
jgi:hypothetical protein